MKKRRILIIKGTNTPVQTVDCDNQEEFLREAKECEKLGFSLAGARVKNGIQEAVYVQER